MYSFFSIWFFSTRGIRIWWTSTLAADIIAHNCAFLLTPQKELSSFFRKPLNSDDWRRVEGTGARFWLINVGLVSPLVVFTIRRYSCPMSIPTVTGLPADTLLDRTTLTFLPGGGVTEGFLISGLFISGAWSDSFLRITSRSFSVDVISFDRAKSILLPVADNEWKY